MRRPSIAWGWCTDVGLVRELNEDYVLVTFLRDTARNQNRDGMGSRRSRLGEISHPRRESKRESSEGIGYGRGLTAAVVADGMGGHSAGEIASKLAAESFVAFLEEHVVEVEAGHKSVSEVVRSAVVAANSVVYSASENAYGSRGMGCTLTAAVIYGQQLVIAHVGDSRAYLVRGQTIKGLTKDHSLVQQKVEAGLLTEAEAAVSPERNQILRAIGVAPEVEVDVACQKLKPGDVVLLTTDGAHSALRDGDIVRAVRTGLSAKGICGNLVEKAKRTDGSDNITVACLEYSPSAGSSFRATSRLRRWELIGSEGVLIGLLAVVLVAIGVVLGRIMAFRGPTPPPAETLQTARSIAVRRQEPSPLVYLSVRAQGRQIWVRRGGIRPVRIWIGGREVGRHDDNQELDAQPGPGLLGRLRLSRTDFLPEQTVEFKINKRPAANTAMWWLKRRPQKRLGRSKRGLWVDGKRKQWSERKGGWYGGICRWPAKTLVFYLDGPTPVQVKILPIKNMGVGNCTCSGKH